VAKKRTSPRKPKGPIVVLVPVRCINCGAMTTMRLPGPAPWAGARFEEPGWSVLNEPEEGNVVFSCGPCFDEEMDTQEKSGHPQIRGEG